MLYIYINHSRMVEAILKGACGNTSLKKLTIQMFSDHLNTVAAELQKVRPQLELDVLYVKHSCVMTDICCMRMCFSVIH